jgi:hypothetical protein
VVVRRGENVEKERDRLCVLLPFAEYGVVKERKCLGYRNFGRRWPDIFVSKCS